MTTHHRVALLSCVCGALYAGAAGAATKPKPGIFVSSFQDQTVIEFNKKGHQLASLNGTFARPVGLTSDANGSVYVANEAASNILVFAAPYKAAPVTVNDPGYYPTGVAQYKNGAWLAVANSTSTSNAEGNLLVYKNNKLVKTIVGSSMYIYLFCAFDAHGNLYVAGQDQNGNPSFGEVANAAGAGKTFTTLTTGNTIGGAAGIAVTASGKIAVLDQGNMAVYTYNPPVNGAFGNPIATTPITGLALPFAFAFASNDKSVWVTDFRNATVSQFAYPAGGSATTTISNVGSNPGGVAVVPPGK